MFFAIPIWPFWVSFSILLIEENRFRQSIITPIVFVSLGWALFFYLPLVDDPQRWLTIRVVHHSIHYDYSELPIFQIVPADWQKVIYLATVALPLVISSGKKSPYFGILVAGLGLIAHVLFAHAFVSVWCFFSAFLAFYLCHIFRDLQPPTPAPALA